MTLQNTTLLQTKECFEHQPYAEYLVLNNTEKKVLRHLSCVPKEAASFPMSVHNQAHHKHHCEHTDYHKIGDCTRISKN